MSYFKLEGVSVSHHRQYFSEPYIIYHLCHGKLVQKTPHARAARLLLYNPRMEPLLFRASRASPPSLQSEPLPVSHIHLQISFMARHILISYLHGNFPPLMPGPCSTTANLQRPTPCRQFRRALYKPNHQYSYIILFGACTSHESSQASSETSYVQILTSTFI